MIVGNFEQFALESHSSEAYERLSFRALGAFNIHIDGHRYGLEARDSTMLACSLDSVKKRIADRGNHVAPFADSSEAGVLANAVRMALYCDDGDIPEGALFCGLTRDEFTDLIFSRDLLWAPDGDEAFDDGSYVIQIDIAEQVRLIGFKSPEGYTYDPGTLSDLLIGSEQFYGTLQRWVDSFEEEWKNLPKISVSEEARR